MAGPISLGSISLHRITPRGPGGSAHGLSTPRREDWRAQSTCRDHDPELFFPVGDNGPALAQAEQAKAICRTCPVIDACLIWAMKNRIEHGVWGGMSEQERRPVKRRTGRRPVIRIDLPAITTALNTEEGTR